MQVTARLKQRGASLTEYALTLATLAAVTLGAINILQDNSEAALDDTGSQIGTPRLSLDELTSNTYVPPNINAQAPLPGPIPAPAVVPPHLGWPAGYGGSNLNYRGGYHAGMDLDPDNGPSPETYQSNSNAFLFNEGGRAFDPSLPPDDTLISNTAGLPVAGPAVCSVYIHYTPVTSGNTLPRLSVSLPGPVVGYALSDSELDDTDEWIDMTSGGLPAGAVDFDHGDRSVSGSEESTITVNAGSFSIGPLTENNNEADAVCVFYNCP